MTHRPALISAHRCGAGLRADLENSRAALDAALALDVEYVELDLQRCADGLLVVFHDEAATVNGSPRALASLTGAELIAATGPRLTYEDALAAIAAAGKSAHLDLKLVSPAELYGVPAAAHEVHAVARAVEMLGADHVVVTSHEDRSVRAVQAWADATGHALLVGLSLGRSTRGLTLGDALRVRLSELFPARRMRDSGANLVVAHRSLARLGAARFARRRGLPLLVWTVDRDLRYWLRPGRAWLVTTNHPARAVEVRTNTGNRR